MIVQIDLFGIPSIQSIVENNDFLKIKIIIKKFQHITK